MSFVQFGEEERDDLFLQGKMNLMHKEVRMCKFIKDLNQKSTKSQCDESSYTIQIMATDLSKFSQGKTEAALLPKTNNTYDFDQSATAMQQMKINSKSKGKGRKWGKRITIEMKGTRQSLNGQGVTKLSNGDVFFAKWENGIVEGTAKVVYHSGNTYVGEVKDYQRCGSGTYVFKKSGYSYEGQFSQGMFQGKGVLKDDYGSVIKKGIWRRGSLVQTFI